MSQNSRRRVGVSVMSLAAGLLVMAPLLTGGSCPGTVDPPGLTYHTTASGLIWADVVVGSGATVQPDSTLQVFYVGRLTDENGDIFGQTGDEPAEFNLQGLIAGWQEGLGEVPMQEGGTRILILPPDLAYGAFGSPPAIGPNATLWFEIEVVAIVADN